MSPGKALPWLQSYGFAALVLLALAGSTFLAFQTDVPEPVPNFALKAEVIYRIEIGLGAFLGFYLAGSLFVSALNGHGITQFGAGGVRVQRIVNRRQQSTILRQERSIEALQLAVKRTAFALQGGLASVSRQNRDLEAKVAALSRRLLSFEDRDQRNDPE